MSWSGVTVQARALGVVPAGRVVLRQVRVLLSTLRLVGGRARIVLSDSSAWRTITVVYPVSLTTTKAMTRVAIR